MTQPENTNQNTQLPSLEALSDAEYLERSRAFGEQWVAFVDGSTQVPAGISGVSEILDERAAAFDAIPEDQRAPFLIEQYRTVTGTFQPVLGTEPITPELLQKAGVRVDQARHGVPAMLTNGLYNQELFGQRSGNFETGALSLTPGALPFVVLHNTEAILPASLETNKRHETTHALWAVARQQEGMPQTGGATVDEHAAFLRIQNEAIAYGTAGQKKLIHTIIDDVRKAGMHEMAGTYEKMNAQFSSIGNKIEPSVAVLGMMQARNFDELAKHIDRLYTITAMMPERPLPPPKIVPSIGAAAAVGWGNAASG